MFSIKILCRVRFFCRTSTFLLVHVVRASLMCCVFFMAARFVPFSGSFPNLSHRFLYCNGRCVVRVLRCRVRLSICTFGTCCVFDAFNADMFGMYAFSFLRFAVGISSLCVLYVLTSVVSFRRARAHSLSFEAADVLLVHVFHPILDCCFCIWHLLACNRSGGPPGGNHVDGLPLGLSCINGVSWQHESA